MTALLLVHGAWHGAWCWRDFAGRLTAAGHDVHTVDLRGHGGSRGMNGKRLPHRIHLYDDVAPAVERIDAPVVVVGHSMGAARADRRHAEARARDALHSGHATVHCG